jgi:hypothetical protein
MRRASPSGANFAELRQCEVRRIPIPGSWVNKGKSKLGLLLALAFGRIVERKPSCLLLHSRKPRGVRLAPVVYDVEARKVVTRIVRSLHRDALDVGAESPCAHGTIRLVATHIRPRSDYLRTQGSGQCFAGI